MLSNQIQSLLEKEIPNAVVTLSDMTGEGNHFEATVVSPVFNGLTRLQRHRLVLDLLTKHFDQNLHAFTFKTLTPEETKQ